MRGESSYTFVMRNFVFLAAIALTLPLTTFAKGGGGGGGGIEQGYYQCSHPETLTEQYKQTLTEAVRAQYPQAIVKCTSCYRSPQEQLNACMNICGKDHCPGLCARPGNSQHQKQQIATCDISGLPDIKQGCDFLKKICDDKFNGLCGIGGYPGGSHHFGAGDDHFSSWNQCKYLKGRGSFPQNTAQDMRDWASALKIKIAARRKKK